MEEFHNNSYGYCRVLEVAEQINKYATEASKHNYERIDKESLTWIKELERN